MNARVAESPGWRAAGEKAPRPRAGGLPDWTAEERSAWILRARRGDLRAQGEIVRRYGVRIAGFVRPMLRQRESVEDAVQVVMIKMVRQLPRLREPERFEPWLFTLARNAVFDQLRRRRCRPETAWEDAEWRRQPDPGANDRSAEVVEALDRATRNFSPAERRVMDRVVAGWSYQAIAAEEQLNLGALKVRIHRMRCQLRQRLPVLLGIPERTCAAAEAKAEGEKRKSGKAENVGKNEGGKGAEGGTRKAKVERRKGKTVKAESAGEKKGGKRKLLKTGEQDVGKRAKRGGAAPGVWAEGDAGGAPAVIAWPGAA